MVFNYKEPEKNSFSPVLGMISFALIGGGIGFLWGHQTATSKAEFDNNEKVSICRSDLVKCYVVDGEIVVKDKYGKNVFCSNLIRRFNECKKEKQIGQLRILPEKTYKD